MITPGWLPLVGIQTVPFAYEIDIAGIDLTGASFAAQVRVSQGSAGQPVAAFAITGPTVVTTNGLPTSSIALALNAGLMAAMPAGPEQGGPWLGYWDLIVSPAGGSPYVLLAGTFTCRPGVTING